VKADGYGMVNSKEANSRLEFRGHDTELKR